MSISGIGIIESGIPLFRLDSPTLKYSSKTEVYQLPIPTVSDMADPSFKISATEEKRTVRTIENQLIGISRTHWDFDCVTFDGVFADKSNHPANNLIVSVSGIEAYISNIYVGGKTQEYSWSGLSQSGPNYLWISLVEEPTTKFYYKSSRQFRDFEARSTTTTVAPIGPENSVLVGTYHSGLGINAHPYGKNQLVLAKDHVSLNKNPHGSKLFQDYILTSGVTVLSPSIWNYQVASGAPSGVPFSNITYLQDLTQYGTLICSGILGNIVSGDLSRSLFRNLVNLEADPANIGYMTVVSGMSISGSLFRKPISILSGITVDGIDLSNLVPLVSSSSISGVPLLHHHSLVAASGTSVFMCPKYAGMTLLPPSFGQGINNHFEYNFDLGSMKPTLRHKSVSGLDASMYLRTIVPTYYNKLDFIDVQHKVDSGSAPILLKVRDCAGTLLTPRLGNVLSNNSGTSTMLVSGLPQSGFSQDLPFDLEFTFSSISGTSQYLGDILIHYKSEKA